MTGGLCRSGDTDHVESPRVRCDRRSSFHSAVADLPAIARPSCEPLNFTETGADRLIFTLVVSTWEWCLIDGCLGSDSIYAGQLMKAESRASETASRPRSRSYSWTSLELLPETRGGEPGRSGTTKAVSPVRPYEDDDHLYERWSGRTSTSSGRPDPTCHKKHGHLYISSAATS